MINDDFPETEKRDISFNSYFPFEKTCFPIVVDIGSVLIHAFVAVDGL